MTFSKRIISVATFSIALVGLTSAVNAQTKGAAKSSLHWGLAPAAFPPGAKMAVEKGDPTKSGEFIVRLSFPDAYKIPPHWHPTDEHVRVLHGEFLVGMGAELDANKTKKMVPGDSGSLPAKSPHFAIARGATEVSVRAMGPFAMTYVNPADDPRKKH